MQRRLKKMISKFPPARKWRLPGQVPSQWQGSDPAGFEEFLIEQNQTKALSCPGALLRSDRKTTHANGKLNALFMLKRARLTVTPAAKKGTN